MATAAEILTAIDTAILDVLANGQHIGSDSKIYTKADLKTLREMRAEYASLAATSASGGVFDRMKTGVPYRGA
jgi:hypothetical protein